MRNGDGQGVNKLRGLTGLMVDSRKVSEQNLTVDIGLMNGAEDNPLGSLNGKPRRQSRNSMSKKQMTMWDMISLHDVNKYKKEADADSIRK